MILKTKLLISAMVFGLAVSAHAETMNRYTIDGIISGKLANQETPALSSENLRLVMNQISVAIMINNTVIEFQPLSEVYKARGYKLIWFQLLSGNSIIPTEMQTALKNCMVSMERHGLIPSDYLTTPVNEAFANNNLNFKTALERELLLTSTLVRMASDLNVGRLDPQIVDQDIKYIRKQFNDYKKIEKIVSDAPVLFQLGFDSFAPQFEQYDKLKNVLQKLRELKASNSWEYFSRPPNADIEVGSHSTDVIKLKNAIRQQGYDFSNADAYLSDDDMKIIKQFSFDHGVEPEEVISKNSNLYKVLGYSVERRILQIEMSMEKIRWLPNTLENRYVYVNLATTHLQVFENGSVTLEFNTVNGNPLRRTPSMRDQIRSVLLNPTWTAPDSITLKDKIPQIRKDIKYLEQKKMHIEDKNTHEIVDPEMVDWNTNQFELSSKYLFIMDPGPENALGIVKFPLLNPYDIYMHDTNERNLFANALRLQSSGCIRLEKPLEFAAYLLARQGKSLQDLQKMVATGQEEEIFETKMSIPLKKENYMTVYTLYQTASVFQDGKVRFMTDYYGQDSRLRMQFDLNMIGGKQ